MSIRLIFAWYDFWVGAFWDQRKRRLYVFPLPMLGLVIQFPAKEPPSTLLPCPHCGEADELYPAHRWPGGGEPYAIDCLGCGADFTPREGADVVAAWNRRP